MNFLEEVRKSLKYRAERPPPREVPLVDFRKALGDFGIIAEYKRASPSGVIRADLPPWRYFEELAQYVDAFSVLTEPFWFMGDLRFVPLAKRFKPVLAKDFVLDKRQIDVFFGYGADAVLIISEFALDKTVELAEYAKRIGMTPLVEVGDAKTALEVLEYGDYLLGINSRDLRTLDLSFERALNVAEAVAGKADFIIESGINKPGQVEMACRKGARGVLIGTALMREPGLAKELREAVKKC
ncbi:indole-3-glycerol-phosphate synthase [Thermoproteus uzoniensis 768-20]|uniref:Indole-3-glycerol phosphate synthase n=1 Tax=Thermoproteus uzoniensis (strain 768-20) TaxID=999630 RepID=F2L2Z3_THEU7|nr:indole-3-glycerol-phosphate synthase [Thermoproteus uzoniensis]AEA13112.1 indole-3-glycerol-phosphate synthase [Thermoproteus uzoniensis 768-20]